MKFPGNDRVVKDYRAQNPKVSSIGIPVGCAYAAIQVLAKAIEMAGTLDREKIGDTIGKGGYDDGERSDQVQTERIGYIVYGFRQWQNGKNVQIWPKEVAVGELLLALPWNKR